MPIYNCKHSGDQYQITKFNRHGEVESSYLCDHVSCQCPAGVRDTCRHRLMLPTFLEEGLVNTNLFLDWDNGRRIVDFNGLPATVQSNAELEPAKEEHWQTFHDLAPQAHTDTEAQDLATTEPKPTAAFILGGFPDWCLPTCETPNECILVGCAKGHGTPPRLVAPAAGDTSGSLDEPYGTSPAFTALGGNWHEIIRAAPEIETTEVQSANSNGWRRW